MKRKKHTLECFRTIKDLYWYNKWNGTLFVKCKKSNDDIRIVSLTTPRWTGLAEWVSVDLGVDQLVHFCFEKTYNMICIYMFLCVYIYAYMCISTYIYTYVYIRVCIYICVCVSV